MLCQKGRKIMLYVETRDKHIYAHNFLNIQPIFNPQKVLETFDPFNIHNIGWYF